MLVRLEIEVGATDEAEPGAVGAAENLLRKLERDRVAGPPRQLEAVADDVCRSELFVGVVVLIVLAIAMTVYFVYGGR